MSRWTTSVRTRQAPRVRVPLTASARFEFSQALVSARFVHQQHHPQPPLSLSSLCHLYSSTVIDNREREPLSLSSPAPFYSSAVLDKYLERERALSHCNPFTVLRACTVIEREFTTPPPITYINHVF
ncbi:hypothetical protein AMTRI_Chr06g192520 [Amborella trichopoda]